MPWNKKRPCWAKIRHWIYKISKDQWFSLIHFLGASFKLAGGSLQKSFQKVPVWVQDELIVASQTDSHCHQIKDSTSGEQGSKLDGCGGIARLAMHPHPTPMPHWYTSGHCEKSLANVSLQTPNNLEKDALGCSLCCTADWSITSKVLFTLCVCASCSHPSIPHPVLHFILHSALHASQGILRVLSGWHFQPPVIVPKLLNLCPSCSLGSSTSGFIAKVPLCAMFEESNTGITILQCFCPMDGKVPTKSKSQVLCALPIPLGQDGTVSAGEPQDLHTASQPHLHRVWT